MINTIRKFFKSNENRKSDNLEGNQDELAYASLLIEVIKSDDHLINENMTNCSIFWALN